MRDVAIQSVPEAASADRAALRLMLEYVEGECRRIGAAAAADHAAQAAALIPEASGPRAPLALAPLH
ncbi:MAG: hypothetical protein V4653_19400 [Pseudomonadota bacterium]